MKKAGATRSGVRKSSGNVFEDLGFECGRVEGFGEQEALGLVDLFFAKVVHLADRLDALGECFQPEVLAELDQGVDQRFRFG